MFLSDTRIKNLLANQDIVIQPQVQQKNIRPAGVRVHLDKEIIKYDDNQVVNPCKPGSLKYQRINIETEEFILEPGQFILGSTVESFKTPRDILGVIDGRSTLARLGLAIHITATITDSLYEEPRTITLEIHNTGNLRIVLSNNMPIGSMLFIMLDQPVAQPVQKQYQNQRGVMPANLENQFN